MKQSKSKKANIRQVSFQKNGNKTTTNLYPVTRTDVEQQKNNQ